MVAILRKERTLNVSNALVKNLLENFGVVELLLNLGDDGLGKLALLPLLDLSLVTHPRVQNTLGLGGDVNALLKLESLGLKLGGFLVQCQPRSVQRNSRSISRMGLSHLRNLEKGLGNVNDASKLLDALDALLHSRGVVGTGSVEDAGDLVDLGLGIAGPGRASILGNSPEDGQQAESDDGLLVDNVEFVADGGCANTGTSGEHGSLGEGAVAGDRNRVEQ